MVLVNNLIDRSRNKNDPDTTEEQSRELANEQTPNETIEEDVPRETTKNTDFDADVDAKPKDETGEKETYDKPHKMLCLFSDGTWDDLENKTPTNIFHLASSLKARNKANNPVISFYDAGIGSYGDCIGEKFKEGSIGLGIDLNIKQLYTFLCMNYEEGDKICLFGFSRGAYTVRSLAGMISRIGLLPRKEINYIDEAYESYREKSDDTEKS